MIYHLLPYINKEWKIYLASGSPRRKELLEQIGLKFEVKVSNFEETLDKSTMSATEYVAATANGKLQATLDLLNWTDKTEKTMVISADTIVIDKDGKILEKPANKEEAYDMLANLSNSSSQVLTAVNILAPDNSALFIESTTVHFAELSDDVIDAYIETKEPMDKAGGYGIQGLAGALIKSITGDYYNVVGLPLNGLTEQIAFIIEEHLKKNNNLE